MVGIVEKICGTPLALECYDTMVTFTQSNKMLYPFFFCLIAVSVILLFIGFLRIKTSKGSKMLFTRWVYYFVGWFMFLLFAGLIYISVVNPLWLKWIS